MTTDRTDKEADRILKEFGPNNNIHFAAMADYARTLEKENAELIRHIKTLTSPGGKAFDRLLIKAFWNGHFDGINSQGLDSSYVASGFNSEIVSAYNNGFHSGQAKRQAL